MPCVGVSRHSLYLLLDILIDGRVHLMPGIVGVIGKGLFHAAEFRRRQVIQLLLHEPFYTAGTFSVDRLDLWIGWTNHPHSFSDCLPIWNESHDICLIFMGENFYDKEQVRRLTANGHVFEPDNATPLIHMYEEMGVNFLRHLNGVYCGVLIDHRKDQIILFNDRFGLGRVYYRETKDGLLFASEAKALLTLLPSLRKLDMTSLAEYFTCGCALQNRTLFRDIALLPGASMWICSPGRRPLKGRYFQPAIWQAQKSLQKEEYPVTLKSTWARVLPRYFQGKQLMALSLTGGKDSRMIMAWAQQPPGCLPCYTFSSMYRDSEDVRLARQVAEACQQPFQTIQVGREFLAQFPRLAEKTIFITDGAMDVSGTPDLYVNRIARETAEVRLTGNYGQEVLHRAVSFKPILPYGRVFNAEFWPLVKESIATYHQELDSDVTSFVAFKQVPWHHFSRLALESSQLVMRSPYLDNELVALSFQSPMDSAQSIQTQLWLISQGNIRIGCIGTDRGSRFHSSPFKTWIGRLQKEWTFKAEYAYDYGMPHGWAAVDHALRMIHLERFFLGRHKFYHFRTWYRDELSEYVKSILFDSKALSRSYVDARIMVEIVNDHCKGVRNYTQEIHRLISAELIHRIFLDAATRS